MPRRSQKRTRGRGNGRRNNSSLYGGITTVAFHRMLPTTLSGVTGMGALACNPNQFVGTDETADNFDLFRATRIEYRLHPMDPTDTTVQGITFVPDVDTQTVTSAQLLAMPSAVGITPFCGVPSPWMKLPRSQLKGMLDWYKCTPDAGSTEFENPGYFLFVGGLSDVLTYEIRGIFQFKNPVSSSLQLERTIARLERLKLVVRIPRATDHGLPCT